MMSAAADEARVQHVQDAQHGDRRGAWKPPAPAAGFARALERARACLPVVQVMTADEVLDAAEAVKDSPPLARALCYEAFSRMAARHYHSTLDLLEVVSRMWQVFPGEIYQEADEAYSGRRWGPDKDASGSCV